MPPHKVTRAQTGVRATDWALGIGLVLAILIVYGQVSHFDFTYYDDPDYVSKNVHVQAGLTADSIKWAFTSVVAGNWSPVTSLSNILVYEFFRMDSGMHHLVNVVFHALAAVMLFAALQRASRQRAASAFVAFLFAVHPLHVESVAWVSERKDVLSAFFAFLALYAYVRYAEQTSVRRYLLVAVPVVNGLMSKKMFVTFPFALLLFDVWPLRRGRFPQVVWEKLPLIALSTVASVIAYFTQRSAGAFLRAPMEVRIENAGVAYVTYIVQTFWPARLAPMYPYPESVAAWEWAAAFAILLGVSAVAIYTWRTRPYIATGWFWYLGTLVPVIGLVQVGAQARADRYTYIPMVGLSMILAWGAVEVAGRWLRTRMAIATAAVVACVACTAIASTQTAYWQDGVTLFQHTVDLDPNNYPAKYQLSLEHYLRGKDLLESGHRAEAIAHFEDALRVRPNWAEVHNNLAIQLASVPGRSAEAIAHFEAAVQLNPGLAEPQRNLGMLLSNVPGRRREAIAHLEAAQRLQPDPSVDQVLNRLREEQK